VKLHEVVDIVIDNHGAEGDAAVALDGIRTGPTSTVTGAAIINAITARAAQILLERHEEAHVLVSQNMQGTEDRNAELLKRYRDRVRLL